MKTSMILAADLDGCIGRQNDIPWYLPADLKRFKALTMGHACIVGSKTQASIVARIGKPMPGRHTIVVSRSIERQPGVLTIQDPASALRIGQAIEAKAGGGEVFVIGGAQIYAALLPLVDRIYLTRVATRAGGDTFMPPGWLDGFEQTGIACDGGHLDPNEPIHYSFIDYERSA